MGVFKSIFGRRGDAPTLDEAAWTGVLDLPVFVGLQAEESARLKELARRLVAEKTFSGAAEAQVDDAMRTLIAAFAALPALNLGYDWYRGWKEIIIYPGQFVPEREVTDAYGVVHRVRHPMSGESWSGGPLVLSWDDVSLSGGGEGYNVVIHEFAHKLDMRNGAVDGLPPLHRDMRVADWSRAFGTAYRDFCRRVDRDEDNDIDPYAAESPAEFFAVLTEYFFEWPEAVEAAYPTVYEQMRRFYRQDPLARLGTHDDHAAP
jgi:MtfA peptidase